MTIVLYDGRCVLCQQTRRAVQALDWLKRIEFLDIHDWQTVQARCPGLDFQTAMGQIHVLDEDGQLLGGFWGMRRILRELPLGFPLWLILHIPGMRWLGPKVYGFIARHRYQINRLLGADWCEDEVCRVHG